MTGGNGWKTGRHRELAGAGGAGRWLRDLLENLYVVVLVFYPLRHVGMGLDLWDTGYSYANFQYMGTEHMDPMWLFATYLTNVVGHFLSGLPGAGTLRGMNVYTGLFVSFLALTGFLFCVRELKMPSWAAFLGEFLALSLCWCPTASFYNYLTYVFLHGCVLLLYFGLTREKKWCLFGAGVCLGANVFVRFSNLPEAALILAVWAYDVILWREMKKAGLGGRTESLPALLGRHTLWCLLGYLAALGVFFVDIQAQYGMGAYVEGIRRLFAMTDRAADYKAASMLFGIVRTYVEQLYWVVRIGVILAAGTVLSAAAGWLEERLPWKKAVRTAAGAASVLLAAAMLAWLSARKFASLLFYTYDSMLRPGILFLMLTMLIALVRILHPDSGRREKLFSGMMLLVVLLTSVGSNNNVYPSLNNLFLAGPYTLWQSWRFVRYVGGKRIFGVRISAFPAKCLLTAFLLMCFFQFTLFGAVFVFAEATGVQNADSYVENNDVLKGIRMSGEKARWMTELSGYVAEEGLAGREVILYGQIPGLSYYLGMPSAFNPWSDLDSYSVERMASDLQETEEEMGRSGAVRPVILIEREYMVYLTGGAEALEELGVGEKRMEQITGDQKWPLLVEFMERNGYEPDFSNGKFTVYL